MTIGVAIIGGGIFAREEHLPAVLASPHLSLLAIYSRSLTSAKTLNTAPSVTIYSDDAGPANSLLSLLSRTDISAVIIALPISNQPAYIRQCLSAGKHVLSEKPIAENLPSAISLIKWYNTEIKSKGITWSVAENFRYLASFKFAAEEVTKKGKPLTFRLRVNNLVEGGKYFETSWRKQPTHQGGFLLDGGVHFVAALRLMLGKENPIEQLSCFSAQTREHLPPVDTVEATGRTKNGTVGTISISFGTKNKGSEYTIASEEGWVSVVRPGVVSVDGKETEVKDERSGVPPEVRAWGKALVEGRSNEAQSPEEALADLELIESMLKSEGRVVDLKWQDAAAWKDL